MRGLEGGMWFTEAGLVLSEAGERDALREVDGTREVRLFRLMTRNWTPHFIRESELLANER
jgi:hypothetical protein